MLDPDPDPDPAIIPGFRIRIQAEKKEESKTKSAKKRVSKSLQWFKRYMNNNEVLEEVFNKDSLLKSMSRTSLLFMFF